MVARVEMVVSWQEWDWAGNCDDVRRNPHVRQRIWEVGLLKFFDFQLLLFFEDLLDPLIQMWRPEEWIFDIRGVMFPLQLWDIYFLTRLLMCGIWEVTHPSLDGRSTVELLVDHHSGGVPNVISDGSLKISRITDLTT